MQSRSVYALRLMIVVVGSLGMVGALIELKAQLAEAREQSAVAELVKAGARVQFFNHDDGTQCYLVELVGCEGFASNDELLRFVLNIRNVRSLTLAPLPLHEEGLDAVLRLEGLASLGVCVGEGNVRPDQLPKLRQGLRFRNPGVEIFAGDKVDGKSFHREKT